VTGDKVKDGSLTGAESNASTLGTVPKATNAASAQPVAFAQVDQGGNLIGAASKNVGSVTRVSTSVYCFSGTPFTPKGRHRNSRLRRIGSYFRAVLLLGMRVASVRAAPKRLSGL
jgi:hypothetical protein